VYKNNQEKIMNKCKACNTTENIIYSGVDAFMLGQETTENICYPCANEQYTNQTTNGKG
jgi:hypothetical protein